jgi:uncharacterized membrane protein YdbT with pleckstrin-like domain
MNQLIWTDKKRIFGLPLSLTRYLLYEDKLIHTKGVLLTSEGEIQLYRVLDVEIKYSLIDRIFGVGTIILYGADVTDNRFYIQKVKNPREVLNMINELVDIQREKLGIKGRELFGAVHSSTNNTHY